jgi:hypothetical protein
MWRITITLILKGVGRGSVDSICLVQDRKSVFFFSEKKEIYVIISADFKDLFK